MDLKTANAELEKLENEYEYWLKEKETILTIVMPKSPDPTKESVQGGTRIDKFAKYVELDDEKKINDTLDFIHKRKQNLLKWLTNELKILNKYGEVEALIIQYKEKGIYNEKEGRFIDMTWEQIAKEVHYSKTFCRNVYRTYKNQRFID
jgi:hypothetical protein